MDNRTKIYSFDIFDTCIIRSCGTYENFLELLSFRVFKGWVSDCIRKKFIFARRTSESELSIDKKSNIFDIYKNIKFKHPQLIGYEVLPYIEIELEKEVDLPVFTIKNEITKLRNNGHRILFISDMYLGENILRPILSNLDIVKNNDKIYVSCDTGCAKHNRTLFEYIKKKENISYNDWIHTGDNHNSDYKIPQKLGIKSQLIKTGYSRYQKQWDNRRGFTTTITSYPYKSILSNLSKNIINSVQPNSRNKLIVDVVAPLYCSFLCYIFSLSQKNGISKLFFFARDTYQMFKVAEIVNLQFPEIIIKYIHISRDAIYCDDSKVLIDYLLQEGVADKNNRCAIVDTSSSGQTITVLNNLLEREGYNKLNVYNLLLHINSNYYNSISNGDFFAYLSQTWSLYDKIECAVIENVFSINDEKRVTSLKQNNNKITVEYDDIQQDCDIIQDKIQYNMQLQTKLLQTYTIQFIKCNLHNYSLNILDEIALPTFFSFIKFPYKEYSLFLDGCKIKYNNKYIPFVKKQKFIHFLRHRGNDTFWKRATIFINLPNFILNIFIKRKLLR